MEERIDNETVQQIDLISMLKDIGREWLTILLLAIAAALFADIWICATYQSEYRTSTTFVVTAKGMNNNIYQNLNSTKELASQFTEILGSNVLKKKVAQDLGMNNLNVKTSVDLVPETNLITFSVKAGTAAESYRVLQSVMENYNTVSDYAIKNVIIETIQQPSVAMAPINPLDEKRTVMKVFVVAAGCLIALLAGISYIRDTIKNPGEVSTKLDTRLLGTIAYEKKSKALSMKRKKDYLSMLIQNPLRSFAYVESSKMAASRVRSYMDKEDVAVGNKQLCGVWQTIAIKVNGEAGLYLDKSSVSMKMGEADTATIMGTYIKADGTELGSDYWANKSNPKLSKLEMVDGDTSIVTAEADEQDGRLLHLTAVSPGKTTITIKCYPFEPTATCNVEVTSDARLVLTPADKLSVVQGDTATIEAKAWDGSAYVENPEITWQSYNTAIATVDDKGGVTGIKKGNVGVAATWNGVTSDPVQVTVVPSRNVSLTTEWNDSDNQDGSRPEKTTVQLTANGQPTGAPVELNADNNWTYEWKQLLAEDEEGTNIVYRVTADAPEDYTAKVTGSADDGFVVTYSHEIAKTSVTASVTWDDADDKDGIRPKSVSFQLKADGENVGDAITVNAGSNWTKTWEDLPEKKAGKALTYTVAVSDIPTEEDQYTVTTSGDAASGFVFKASHVSTSVEIPVSVTWDDAENQDGARIEAVEAELYANGEATGNKVTLNAENNWTAKFASVDVKKDGTRIKYEVKGTEADGYDVSVAGDILDEKGLVLTYKHIPAVVNVSARVSWNDANNQDGIRPTDTLVQLYADGTALGDKAVIESNKEWTKTWSNLPKYKAGKEIAYNMIAYAVSGYTVKVTGNALEGYKAEYTHNVQKMNVTVQNAWNDLDNVVDSRPAQLVVEIYANGKTTGKRVTLTEANNWKATVSGLDRNASGKRIQYAVKAVGTPAGYNISVSTDANGNIKLISNFTTYTKKLRLKLSKTSYIYNGKNAKPKVTVYNGRKKVSSKYYKVTYKNNKKVGYATVIVKGKGKFAKYAGKAAFTIKLKTLKKPSVKKGAKGTLNVSWKRDRQATKYVVQYSQSNKFKGKSTKTVTITNNKIGKTVLKGLTGKKNYYVRVRSCKAVNGRKIWSSWSSRSSKVKVK